MRTHKEALLLDLRRLQGELPEIIAAVEAGDERAEADAIALTTGASRERFAVAERRLIDYVLAQAKQGNSQPLSCLVSGQSFLVNPNA